MCPLRRHVDRHAPDARRFWLVIALLAAILDARIGALPVSVNSFLWAFLGAMAFPGLALAVAHPWTRRSRAGEADVEGGTAF
jgi:hypothetical protein